ncbi:MAG: RCC1 repeat-containing protein, partial [Actinobacteria bacterium]|nr:RCC1 repeat-containing protein [Actinomycetota bacterium]NIS30692.1 RCC1 repeat-containing protein [Actinomycetota bacterium]NIU65902.1 RCC1 repeat-containing protein [Actinomycetota bacterium]NIV86773.1 RCC1 repeat-containing protein [Actinomycetota bacterium]NIW27693.1 RCC1 repeat-containing protein [Actinomycetota bacterium]
ALDLQDRTFCWGANSVGQLGDGTTDASLEPVQVTSTLAFARLAIGNNHGCGITSGGLVQCWGANGVGQLGDGTTTNRPT